MTALVWLRRDLRLRDHPALRAALERHDRVVPAFCFDRRLLAGRHGSGARTQFLLESLGELRRELGERGGRLFVRSGRPERVLVELAAETGCTELHLCRDVSPFARARDRLVARACREAGIEIHGHPGLNVVDVAAIETRQGRPYTVFSPFLANWLDAERRPVLAAPRSVRVPSRPVAGRLPSLAALGLRQEVAEPPPGGEGAGRARMSAFLRAGVRSYAEERDALDREGTSRLSPYLHLGCISPRELEDRLPGGPGAEAFRRQLCWRDFHHHVLLHFPASARSELQAGYRGRLRWSRSRRAFGAWCAGRTGYPLVDAAMRQLAAEGWMHNRARMVVGSFLTKDLGIDWRWGERHFMRLLVDGDEASNNGNWQWVASVGVDPRPPGRRLYNPALHQERYDPANAYVRRYLPELAEVPDEFAREPWRMPPELQREVGCVIGEDYPEPIVDHLEARREALDRYAAARRRAAGPNSLP